MGLLALSVLGSVYAQQKKKYTLQYTPNINKKSVSGVITKITNSTIGNQKLFWFHLGDTVVHVWEKDLTKEMAVGNTFSFHGIQRLVGVKKHIEN